MPLADVSIVIACRNAEKTIAATLESVCRYAGTAELIVVDGASTDSTLKIISRYRERVTTLISEPDKGIYDALSKGFRCAQRTWVYVLGSDDVLLPGFQSAVPFLTDSDVVYYGRVRLVPSGRLYGGKTSSIRLLMRNISHQATYFPRRHWDRLGGFDPSFPLLADYALNLKAYWDTGLRYEYVDEVVCEYSELGLSSGRPDPDAAFSARKGELVRDYAPLWLFKLYQLNAKGNSMLRRLRAAWRRAPHPK